MITQIILVIIKIQNDLIIFIKSIIILRHIYKTMNINQRSTIIITIRDKKIDEERSRNILGWDKHSAILREKTHILHRAKQIHTHMCFKSYAFLSQDTTTRQIDRVQWRISESYEHHCLKDNIEKKRRTYFRKL